MIPMIRPLLTANRAFRQSNGSAGWNVFPNPTNKTSGLLNQICCFLVRYFTTLVGNQVLFSDYPC